MVRRKPRQSVELETLRDEHVEIRIELSMLQDRASPDSTHAQRLEDRLRSLEQRIERLTRWSASCLCRFLCTKHRTSDPCQEAAFARLADDVFTRATVCNIRLNSRY